LNDWRYERKFALENIALLDAENVILSNKMFFKELYHERRVNNIYLDTVSLESYNSNMEGLSKRKKYRIRWYGDLFAKIDHPVLEIKIKNSTVGTKYKYKIHSFELIRRFDTALLQEIINESNLPDNVLFELSLLDPSLINTYSRKYYLSANGKYRVTIDRDLSYYYVTRGMNYIVSKRPQSGVVIEIKYLEKNDKYIDKITNSFPFRLTRSSKYVQGVRMVNGLFY
jgi:hypothetical protein